MKLLYSPSSTDGDVSFLMLPSLSYRQLWSVLLLEGGDQEHHDHKPKSSHRVRSSLWQMKTLQRMSATSLLTRDPLDKMAARRNVWESWLILIGWCGNWPMRGSSSQLWRVKTVNSSTPFHGAAIWEIDDVITTWSLLDNPWNHLMMLNYFLQVDLMKLMMVINRPNIRFVDFHLSFSCISVAG